MDLRSLRCVVCFCLSLPLARPTLSPSSSSAPSPPTAGSVTSYRVRYLNVTAAALLDNRRLMHGYVRCFAGDGPCPPQARQIKKLLPELAGSGCARCDVILRRVFERCAQLLEHHYPVTWSKMAATAPKVHASPNAI